MAEPQTSTSPAPASDEIPAHTGIHIFGAKVSEVQQVEDLLRYMGKDPGNVTLSEAKEIAHILSYSSHHADRNFYRWFFAILGIFVVVAIISMVILALNGKTIPDSLIVIGSVALGLFAGVLICSCRQE
jgi:hypothetical protein